MINGGQKSECNIEEGKKIPQHLSFVFPYPNESTLAELTILLDFIYENIPLIRFITIYDSQGIIKKQSSRSKLKTIYTILNSFAPLDPSRCNDSESSRFMINFISKEDSHERLLRTISPNSIVTPSTLTKCLNGNHIPFDPELILIIDKDKNLTKFIKLHGFPPWMLHLSEIITMESISIKGLLDALAVYQNTNQRFGK